MYRSDRETAFDILEELRMYACADNDILDYIIGNNLSSDVALRLMRDCREEFLGDIDNEEDED